MAWYVLERWSSSLVAVVAWAGGGIFPGRGRGLVPFPGGPPGQLIHSVSS